MKKTRDRDEPQDLPVYEHPWIVVDTTIEEQELVGGILFMPADTQEIDTGVSETNNKIRLTEKYFFKMFRNQEIK